MVMAIAVLCSATTPTAQTQPIRTYPASVVFQGNSFDCGPAALATLLQLRLQRPVSLLELTQTVPEMSRQEWRRVETEGYSFGQLVTMAAAVGARATLRRLTARGLAKSACRCSCISTCLLVHTTVC
jgi:predicted double-glycine peptidase